MKRSNNKRTGVRNSFYAGSKIYHASISEEQIQADG